MFLLFNTRRFTGELAQVVKFGTTNRTAANDFNFLDAGRMYREHALNADAVRNSADGEHFAHAATLTTNDDAFKNLNTFAVAFDDFCMDTDGIARRKIRNVVTELFLFNKFDDVHIVRGKRGAASHLLKKFSFDVRARTQRNALTACKV